MKLKLIILSIIFSFSVQAEELRSITANEYILESPSLERRAIIESLLEQFNNKAIFQQEINKVWDNIKVRESLQLARFQIVGQKLYAAAVDETYPHFRSYIRYFRNLLKRYKIQDVDFIVSMVDSIHDYDFYKDDVSIASTIPFFMMSKDLDNEYERDKLIIPDPFMLWHTYEELLNKIDQANLLHTWNTKIEQIFWRGSTSTNIQGQYNIDNFSKLPRLSLVMLSKLYPDLINAKFTYYMDGSFDFDQDDNLKNLLDILNVTDLKRVAETAHLKYKYLISIDGHTCAWRRVPWIMYSNSVLVKQQTNKVEWFYPALVPFVHYVPVNENLTNIVEQLQWMQKNDSKLREISKNARNFVQNELMPKNIDAHMVIILNKYHEIQQDKQLSVSLPSIDEVTSYKSIALAVFRKIKRNFIRLFI